MPRKMKNPAAEKRTFWRGKSWALVTTSNKPITAMSAELEADLSKPASDKSVNDLKCWSVSSANNPILSAVDPRTIIYSVHQTNGRHHCEGPVPHSLNALTFLNENSDLYTVVVNSQHEIASLQSYMCN